MAELASVISRESTVDTTSKDTAGTSLDPFDDASDEGAPSGAVKSVVFSKYFAWCSPLGVRRTFHVSPVR